VPQSLDKIFNPRSIAVIGASEVPGKASERRTRSLIESGYAGNIYLINPKRDRIFSRKTYPSILDVDEPIDLVMVVISPQLVTSAVVDSIKKGAKGIIIITAGLGEAIGKVGNEGKKIEQEILAEALKAGTQVIGPNCSGIFSASAKMNILGVPPLSRGPLSVIAQSGNVIDSLTHYAQRRGLGFSKIVSTGNAVGVKLHEYIDYLKDDPDTKVIAIYLEGIKEGNKLIESARETVKKKPIVALKVGETVAGARAAASHTGSLTGDSLIVNAAFNQAGIIRVSDVDTLFDVAAALTNCPLPERNRIAILSEGGGDNAIAADHAEKYGIEVPVLSQDTQEKMRPHLITGISAANPVDYGGTAEENPHVITECVKVCMEDSGIDSVFVTGFFGGFKDIIAPHISKLEEQTSKELVELVKNYRKPLVIHSSFAGEQIEALDILKSNGIPVFESSERGIKIINTLMQYSNNKRKLANMQILETVPKERPSVKAILKEVKDQKRTNLLETESRDLLRQYAVTLPPARMVTNIQEAVDVADLLGYPLAMKIVSPDIIHKSDIAGVKLNLSSRQEIQAGFEEIIGNAVKVIAVDQIRGVLLSPMAPEGQECIIGMIRDQQFGPVIMFGLGGIFVEVLKDVTFRVAPLVREDIDDMICGIRGYRLLDGIRGEKRKDVNAIKETLKRISEIAIDNPEIREIDLNPVIIHEKGISIVDSRVIIG